MAVGVERYRDGGVSEPLLDDLGVDACLEREGRVGVSQIVQPYLRQPGVADVMAEGPRE